MLCIFRLPGTDEVTDRVKSGADGQNLNEIDNNNREFRCQTKLPKMPGCREIFQLDI